MQGFSAIMDSIDTVFYGMEGTQEEGTQQVGFGTMESERLFLRPIVSKDWEDRVRPILERSLPLCYSGRDDLECLADVLNSGESRIVNGIFTVEEIEKMVQNDSIKAFQEGNPLTGYLIYRKGTNQILGRGEIELGAVPGAVPGEVQIRVFFISPIKEDRKELYRELMLTLFVGATQFAAMKLQNKGEPISRIKVDLKDSDKQDLSGDKRKEFIMKQCVVEEVFGSHKGCELKEAQRMSRKKSFWD